MEFPVRRLLASAIVTALLVAGSAARADTVQDLAAIAGKKGPVIWYESSPPEAVLKIAAAFNKKYPDIKIQFVRNTGGGGIAARIIQQSEAGAATASFFIGDVAQLIPLNQRSLLLARDWNSLGVDPALSPTPYAVAATAALGVLVLLAWLSTLEGAKAYEAAIGRGNPLIKGTETNERIGKVKLVEFSFADAATIEKVDAELTQMLMAA